MCDMYCWCARDVNKYVWGQMSSNGCGIRVGRCSVRANTEEHKEGCRMDQKKHGIGHIHTVTWQMTKHVGGLTHAEELGGGLAGEIGDRQEGGICVHKQINLSQHETGSKKEVGDRIAGRNKTGR